MRGTALALRICVPVRFTIPIAVAISFYATSAVAQPALTRPVETCEEGTNAGCDDEFEPCGLGYHKPCKPLSHPNDVPWKFLVAVGGGFPLGVQTEAGVRVGNAYFYGGLAWGLPETLEPPPAYRLGVDGIFGKRGHGFAGAGMAGLWRRDEGDDEVTAVYGRIGLNAPASRHLSVRLWGALGAFLWEERCIDPNDCEYNSALLPWLELNLALAYRM